MNKKKVPIVIPAYEPKIGLVFYVRKLAEEGLTPIYIVNDGSGDLYDPVFSELNKMHECTLINHSVNKGKGRALKSAFEYILDNEPDAIGCITVDSDGQHAIADVQKCRDEFCKDSNCLIMGVRDFSDKSIPLRSRFGNNFIKRLYHRLENLDLQDTQTGLRAYPKNYMKLCLNVPGERFDFENRALLAANDAKISIVQVPIETIYSDNGDYTSHFSPIKDSLIIYRIVISHNIKSGKKHDA